jgi:hypothetical protein
MFGMSQLPLNHDQWDAFAGHLDGVRVAKLMWREPAPDSGLGGCSLELSADG